MLNDLLETLARANRILAQHQVVDSFGHVSARHPERPDRFLLSRSISPALVQPHDILEFDLDGNPVEDTGQKVYLERFIHGGIYAARDDVQSVVHSHSPTIVAMGIVRASPFRAVCHTCGFLGSHVPNFEIRDAAGDGSDMLIRSVELGHALAKTLGKSKVVLMRGHGSTAVGASIEEAVYNAVYAEVNARIQTTASMFGEITPLSDAEIEGIKVNREVEVSRAWGNWVRSVSLD